MRRILFTLLILLSGLLAFAQEVAPVSPVPVNGQFYITLPDSAIYQYGGRPVGWHRVAKYKDVKALKAHADSLYKLKSDSTLSSGYVSNTALNDSLAAHSLTFYNGVTKDIWGRIMLGGALAGNTTIAPNYQSFTIGETDGRSVSNLQYQPGGYWQMRYQDSFTGTNNNVISELDAEDGDVLIKLTDPASGNYKSIYLDGDTYTRKGILIVDNINSIGLNGASDFSAYTQTHPLAYVQQQTVANMIASYSPETPHIDSLLGAKQDTLTGLKTRDTTNNKVVTKTYGDTRYVTLGTTQTISGLKNITNLTNWTNTSFTNAVHTYPYSSVGQYGFMVYGNPGTGQGVISVQPDHIYWQQGIFSSSLGWNSMSANRDITLPNSSGTLALTSDITTATGSYIPLSQIGAINGVAPLDGGGKVPLINLPANILVYKGQWNPATNTPTLANGTGTSGYVYEADTAGTINLGSGSITFYQGDFVIYNGTAWQYSGSTDRVTSVNGQQGIVVLNTDNVGEGSTNKYWTAARTGALYAPIISPSFTGTPSTTSLAVTGTGGNGFINLVSQSSAPTTPAASTQNIYTDAAGQFAIMGNSGFASSFSKTNLTANRVFTFPDASIQFTGDGNTTTLLNKRITKRVQALSANAATYTINTDSYDYIHITAQTATITNITTTGTPVDGDMITISITGTASVPFTFDSSKFEASGGCALSTTTSGTIRLDMGFKWDTETNKWRIVAAI